jgi:hypothetical protein
MFTIKTGQDLYICAAWKSDTHTPATGLTPTITVWDVFASTIVPSASGASMDEVGNGIYKYTFDGDDVDPNKVYAVYMDGGATLSTYRYQYGAFAGNFGNEDTIATIDTNVDAVLEDTGTTLPATLATIDSVVDALTVDLAALDTKVDGLAALGTGDYPHILSFVDDGGTPRAGMLVWLTLDAAGTNLFTAKKLTNSGGLRTFYVDLNTTYYVWDENHSTYVGSFTKTSA